MVMRILGHYDATPHIGLNVIVYNSAIERTDEIGEQTIELPKQRELRATAAVLRCLMPEQLQAAEIEALRKILALPEWHEPKGKALRLLVCETLRHDAPGVVYDREAIDDLEERRTDLGYQVEPIRLHLILETWTAGLVA